MLDIVESLNTITDLHYIGLLTDQQKKAGYVVLQDGDFIYLLHANSGNKRIVGVFEYEIATVKEIRETAEKDLRWHYDTLTQTG